MLYTKRYDKKTKTYHYRKHDGSNVFYGFRAGFGGDEEWTFCSALDNSAFGMPSFEQGVYSMMGYKDFMVWMENRKRP